MKKFILSLITAAVFLPSLRADEGMWLLPLLEKINSETMRNLGSRLTPEQIYSINNSSIKDAVVQFGGGCTGEIISGSGLLVTNHHCGYLSIQRLSSETHNYLEDGYWAMDRSEEIPVPGLSVTFLQKMWDVTEQTKDQEASEALVEKVKAENPNCEVRIVSFFNSNVRYIVVNKVYRDVRFVGAPPSASGKFGGDTDNWMWPRHTCDFSMFRVYAGKDNEPADYSEDNIPFTPRQFLNISLKGVEEGDFAMIMGYPGSTQRYKTAVELEEMLDINDIRIAARTIRQDVLWKEMRADNKVGLQYASKYASSSNGWKKWIGMKEAFEKLDVLEREKEKEAALKKWIDARKSRVKKYGAPMADIAQAVEARADVYRRYIFLSETLAQIEIISLARSEDTSNYKDYDADVDRKVAHAMVKHYLENAAPDGRVDVTEEEIDRIFDTSAFASEQRLEGARAAGIDLSQDPAVLLMNKVITALAELYKGYATAYAKIAQPSKTYAAALLEWTKDKPSYPDANMTCRLTYGTVKGYEPKDGVIYKYYTTLKGVMEKEDPSNYEFRVPSRLKELYEQKDFGQYADENGEIVTCFLTNLDITGGNSGSPVMDADGNLIGLAFDGNWEAMSGDVIFEPNLQRCICVDIRYVLFMMDKFGRAGWLLDEMNIVR